MKLGVNDWQLRTGSRGTLGMSYILSTLIKSNQFEVNYHNDFLSTGGRDYRATILHVNEFKVYMDFWEYAGPTHTEPVFDANFDLIIRLQHPYMSFEEYLKTCYKNNTFINRSKDDVLIFFNKTVPFTFFPSRIFESYIGKEQDLWSNEIKQYGFFCGKDWKCRRNYKAKIIEAGLEYLGSQQELSDGKPLTDEAFIEKMKSSKIGIVLHGRHGWASDMKNRREIDYFMMKKPLVLNYKPKYYDDLIDGEHYIFWDKQNILKMEQQYDLQRIAENGYQWYLRNASPTGIVNVFKKILQEKLGVV